MSSDKLDQIDYRESWKPFFNQVTSTHLMISTAPWYPVVKEEKTLIKEMH